MFLDRTSGNFSAFPEVANDPVYDTEEQQSMTKEELNEFRQSMLKKIQRVVSVDELKRLEAEFQIEKKELLDLLRVQKLDTEKEKIFRRSIGQIFGRGENGIAKALEKRRSELFGGMLQESVSNESEQPVVENVPRETGASIMEELQQLQANVTEAEGRLKKAEEWMKDFEDVRSQLELEDTGGFGAQVLEEREKAEEDAASAKQKRDEFIKIHAMDMNFEGAKEAPKDASQEPKDSGAPSSEEQKTAEQSKPEGENQKEADSAPREEPREQGDGENTNADQGAKESSEGEVVDNSGTSLDQTVINHISNAGDIPQGATLEIKQGGGVIEFLEDFYQKKQNMSPEDARVAANREWIQLKKSNPLFGGFLDRSLHAGDVFTVDSGGHIESLQLSKGSVFVSLAREVSGSPRMGAWDAIKNASFDILGEGQKARFTDTITHVNRLLGTDVTAETLKTKSGGTVKGMMAELVKMVSERQISLKK